MRSTSDPARVAATDFDWPADQGPAATVRAVLDAATEDDGVEPVDEATRLALRHGLGATRLWLAGSSGFAWRHDEALDLVVAPGRRGHGTGTALARAATAEPGPLTAWSHGNHPAAAALGSALGFARVRDLWVMRRPLIDLPPLAADEADPDTRVRAFEPGRDEDAFLAVNAAAFAHHPEQGGLTRAGLDERMAEPWFDPAGFFLAERDGTVVGFHWTKVHPEAGGAPAYGEVYVVGIAPGAQGGGLGRRLTLTGLHHLATQGLGQVLLYVESDNDAAVRTYTRLGFGHAAADTHVQYAREG